MHKFKKSKALEEALKKFASGGEIETGTEGWCSLLAIAFPTAKHDIDCDCFEDVDIDIEAFEEWLADNDVEAV